MFRLNKTRNLLIWALSGFLVFGGVIFLFDLPARIIRGEDGHAAIQMLDAMRRPFLAIKEAETRLVRTGDMESAAGDLEDAIKQGDIFIARYQRLAGYNPELSGSVARLAEAYQDWVVLEQHLLDHFPDSSALQNDPGATRHILENVNKASHGFLATMNQLGEGEAPVHVDLDAGRQANHLFLTFLAVLVLYLFSLLFLQQRSRTRFLQHARDELEVRVAERTHELIEKSAELERSNRELDQFAYVTAHDLKAPLRAIANLSQWIEEDIGEQLEGATRKQMGLLRGRVRRMEDLIDGILHYSQVGRMAVDIETVDVGELLAEIIDGLHPPEGISIDIAGKMPVFEAARVRLSQVFANLLSNAIKYHDRADGQVSVSVKDIGEFYEFTVADDGPGIAPEYHDKVFQLFQTLIEVARLSRTHNLK